MKSQLPLGLQSWLSEQGWFIIQAIQLVGGFSAILYKIRVRTQLNAEIEIIYKQGTPNRTQELVLYKEVLCHLKHYAPRLLGNIQTVAEHGIIIEYAGQPLKSVISQQSRAQKKTLLDAAVVWLATMHIEFAQMSRAWLQSGCLDLYSIESAYAFAQTSIQALQWLCKQRLCNLEISTTFEVQRMAEWFYPRYPKWQTGRRTLTHGDTHLENLLQNGHHYCLIDWEYACIAVPSRDLTIFLQDILEDDLHNHVRKTYQDYLAQHGWDIKTTNFEETYQACLFENTLMMLGWEIQKFRTGNLTKSELEKIVRTKLKWLRQCYARLVL